MLLSSAFVPGSLLAAVDAPGGAPLEKPETAVYSTTDQRSPELKMAAMPNAPNVRNAQDFQLPPGNEVRLSISRG